MRMSNTTTARLLTKQADSVAQVLKSLAHPVRLKILCQLLEGEQSVGDLTEFCGISQSAMSQFLNRMRAEGVLASRREGHFVYYVVADPRLGKLLRALKEIYC